MRKEISKAIGNKIIKKTDLIKITNFIFNEYKKCDDSSRAIFNITIHCENNEIRRYEKTNLEENSILDLKKILRLKIDFTDYQVQKNIVLELHQGNDEYFNQYTVAGDEDDWVNSTDIKIEEILYAITPQNKIFKKIKRIMFHFLSLNIGFFFSKILFLILDKLGYKPIKSDPDLSNPFTFLFDKLLTSFPTSKYIFYVAACWWLGMGILFLFWPSYKKYWENICPSIEFDFGPEHTKYSKINRKRIATITTLILIPMLLQIIFAQF